MKASQLFEDNELKTYERLILKPDDNNEKSKTVSAEQAGITKQKVQIDNSPKYTFNKVKEEDTSLFKRATGISPEDLPVETRDFFQRTFKDAFRPYE
jgi:hypothetical protein